MNIQIGDAFQLIKDIEDKSINLVITSPPYEDAVSYGKKVDNKIEENYVEWFIPLAKEIERTLTEDGSFILNINDKINNGYRSLTIYKLIIKITEETNLKLFDRYIWYKKNGLPTAGKKRLNDRIEYIFHFVKNKDFKCYPERIQIPQAQATIDRYKYAWSITKRSGFTDNGETKLIPLGYKMKDTTKPDNVFRFSKATSRNVKRHPARFNPELPRYFINWLTDPQDIIFDPFAGTGTTIKGAGVMNREAFGFEINENYII